MRRMFRQTSRDVQTIKILIFLHAKLSAKILKRNSSKFRFIYSQGILSVDGVVRCQHLQQASASRKYLSVFNF